MTAFNTTRTLRRMFNGTDYLDRAAPRFAPAKFLALAFTPAFVIGDTLVPGGIDLKTLQRLVAKARDAAS